MLWNHDRPSSNDGGYTSTVQSPVNRNVPPRGKRCRLLIKIQLQIEEGLRPEWSHRHEDSHDAAFGKLLGKFARKLCRETLSGWDRSLLVMLRVVLKSDRFFKSRYWGEVGRTIERRVGEKVQDKPTNDLCECSKNERSSQNHF
jgi:hypothetical protein